jgi:hypothetical protein
MKTTTTRLHVFALSALLTAGLVAVAAGQEPTSEVTLVAMSHAAGLIAPEAKDVRERFAVDAPGDLAFVVASPAKLHVEVMLPDGRVVSESQQDRETAQVFTFALDEAPAGVPLPGLGRGEHTLVRLPGAPAGSYELRLTAGEGQDQPVPFAITILPSSTLRLGLVLPETEIPVGQAVAISALLFDDERPVGEASVVALVTPPTAEREGFVPPPVEIALRDDGALPDVAAGDGLFSGLFAPKAAGEHTVLVKARGRAAMGLPFERDTAGALGVRERRARLGDRYETEAVDGGKDPEAPVLLIRSTVAIDEAGLYDLAVTLRAENGRTVSAHTLSSYEPGDSSVVVGFSAADLRSLGMDGPCTLALVRLDQVGASGVVMADRQLEAGSTIPVSLESFPVQGR